MSCVQNVEIKGRQCTGVQDLKLICCHNFDVLFLHQVMGIFISVYATSTSYVNFTATCFGHMTIFK
jgi:hypothetical protein